MSEIQTKTDISPEDADVVNQEGVVVYLRARGRGRGLGRPAELGKRLVLEGEETVEVGEEENEEAEEWARYFSRRQLGSNADRYVTVEPEPALSSNGITSHWSF
jgi:hypothetical protein